MKKNIRILRENSAAAEIVNNLSEPLVSDEVLKIFDEAARDIVQFGDLSALQASSNALANEIPRVADDAAEFAIKGGKTRLERLLFAMGISKAQLLANVPKYTAKTFIKRFLLGAEGLALWLGLTLTNLASSIFIGDTAELFNSIKRQAKDKFNLLFFSGSDKSALELPDSIYDIVMENVLIVEEVEPDSPSYFDYAKSLGSTALSWINPFSGLGKGFGGYDFTSDQSFLRHALDNDFKGLTPKEIDLDRCKRLLIVQTDILVKNDSEFEILKPFWNSGIDDEIHQEFINLTYYRYIDGEEFEKIGRLFIRKMFLDNIENSKMFLDDVENEEINNLSDIEFSKENSNEDMLFESRGSLYRKRYYGRY